MAKGLLLLSIVVFSVLILVLFKRNIRKKSLIALGIYFLIVFLICFASTVGIVNEIRHPVFTGSKGSWLRESKLDEAFSKLNETGQFEAIKRVEELTEIEKYKKKD